MAEHDPNLAIQIEDDVAEVGAKFRCSVQRSPADGESNSGGRGQIRSVEITLGYFTEGRATVDKETVSSATIPVDEYGMASGDVELAIPADAPISYDGRLIRVRWQIEATTDIKLGRDQKSSAFVLVVPVGGHGLYESPHPLRRLHR